MKRREFLNAGATALAANFAVDLAGQAKKRFRVVDVHQHIFNSPLQGSNGIPKYYPESNVEYLLELMDLGGVDKGFLISYNAEDVASEMRGRGQNPVELRDVANKKYQYSSFKAHQDRFWWFPDHINPLHEDYLDKLQEDFRNGASGIKMLPIFHGLLPDHKGWIPVYELCRKYKKSIIIDLSWWYWGKYPIFNESAERRKMAEGFRHFGDYAQLLNPLLQQFKEVPWSLAHCGTAHTHDDYKFIFETIGGHTNVSCDVAAVMDFSPAFIQELVGAVGVHKVMYGTDTPYWFKGRDSYISGKRRWGVISDDCRFLGDKEKQMILAGNAERFARYQMAEAG